MKKLLSLAVVALSLLTASAFAETVTAPVTSTPQVAKNGGKKHHKHRKHHKKH